MIDERRPRFSTSDVARMFGVTRATLYRWVRQEKIPELWKDPDNGWPLWQQNQIDAVALLVKTKKRKKL